MQNEACMNRKKANHIHSIRDLPIYLLSYYLLGVLLSVLFLDPVYADVAPHPMVAIAIKNSPDITLYGTMLSSTESNGPYDADDIEKRKPDEKEEARAFDAFNNFATQDSFFFWGEVHDFKDGDFYWSYYPPDDFKILIYDLTDKVVYASDEVSRYAFDSYYSVSLQEDGTLSVTRTPHFELAIGSFFARLFLTLMIELLIATIFGYRDRKSIWLIVAVNCVSQAVLNLFLAISLYYHGQNTWNSFILLYEIIVFFIEAIILAVGLKSKSKLRAVLYSFAANLSSFLLGLFVFL